MRLYDFAAVLISWVFMASAVVQLKLCSRTLPKPNNVCLLVKGQFLDVLKDTGADKSCMELGKALELGLGLSFARDAQAQFRLPNGKVISSVATTRAHCSGSDNDTQLHFTGQFFVFERLHVPVLLGNDILDDDGEIRWDRPLLSNTFPRAEIHLARGGTQTIRVVLDTGASCNFISMAELMKLGYQPDQNKAAEFCLANGKVIKSMGQSRLRIRLSLWDAPRSADFQVFKKMEVPVILGAELSFQMARLGPAQGPNCEDSVRLVTHLSRKSQRPTRQFRCFVNNKMVRASADTGSDLNLISPSAVSRLSDTSSIETEDLDITLADGSKAHINASFQASFSPYSAPKESLTERLYIQEGLTADIFLGRQLLDKIGAFTRNQASFSHSLEKSMFYNLNVAALLSKPSVKLLSMFRTGRRARSKSDVSSIKPTLSTLPPASTIDGDFYEVLKVVAAYETHLREKTRAEIASLSGVHKTIAQDAENWRIERYKADLKRRLDERKQASISAS